jgi:Co/Zn/Cd efflux system component
MADCCDDKACEIEPLRARQGVTLKTVFAINAVMFVVESVAGLLSGSISLFADSLDMLGDALVYGVSIYVVARGERAKAVAALCKGLVMAAFGFFVLGQAVYRLMFPQVPTFEAMGLIGLLALVANATCLVLLWRHRTDDINMQSVWLCSRNDIIANVSVLAAALGVWLAGAGWPDIVVGVALAALFLRSSLFVIRAAAIQLRPANA